jgi:cysteine desulfurase
MIYFDNAASTKVDPRVLEAMLPFFCENYANPSALHSPSQTAKAAIEEARESVAELLGQTTYPKSSLQQTPPRRNNTVLGTFDGKLLVSAIEHPSVRVVALGTGRAELITVDTQGTIDVDAYASLLNQHKPQLVSIMSVNNEIGAVQDIDKLATMAKDAGAHFHSDITQGVGKCRLDLGSRPIDYATLSGHKFHAPKGVGILWARSGAPIKPFMLGGTHEAQRRAGTINVPLVIAMGEAARIILEQGEQEAKRMRAQRDRIVQALTTQISDCRVNGQTNGAPHILSISFYRTEGESIIINLDARGICCTAGAACSSGQTSAAPC